MLVPFTWLARHSRLPRFIERQGVLILRAHGRDGNHRITGRHHGQDRRIGAPSVHIGGAMLRLVSRVSRGVTGKRRGGVHRSGRGNPAALSEAV